MAGREITCANCGADVDIESEERCPACDAPLRIVCPNCGTYAAVDDEYCPSCDASLAHATQGS